MPSTILRVLSAVAFIVTLVINALANILPINGLNTGEVSARYPSLFTPESFTFSIWIVIYGMLAGFLIYCWVHRNDQRVDSILGWFIASCFLNTTWILVWHHLKPGLSVVVMLFLLVTLLVIFLSIHAGNFLRPKELVWVSLPFTLYFAWICVATIANVSAFLVSVNWSVGVLSEEGWTALMMIVAATIAVIVTKQFVTPGFIVVVMWALLGIYIRWRESEYESITTTAVLLETALAGLLIYFSRRKVKVLD